MNWHVRVVSFFIVLLFAGFAFYYFRLYVSPKKHGVILFVVPGTSAEVLREASAKRLDALAQANQTALVQIDAHDDYASLMTRVASGRLGKQRQLGLDAAGRRLDTLLYRAQRKHRSVGVVSTGSLTSPGVAAFFSHVKNAFEIDLVALNILDSTDMDVVLGGGEQAFAEAYRNHERDLFKEAEQKGYDIVRNKKELEDLQAWMPKNLLGVFPKIENSFRVAPIENVPVLADLTRRAIQKLQYHLGGYFLIIEHELVARAAPDEAFEEIIELDNAVNTALAYAGKNALVMVFFPASEIGWVFLYGEKVPDIQNLVTPAMLHDFIANEL
ncbi:MAG: alkaline phosphatase [Verrucomicrobiota bacterium]